MGMKTSMEHSSFVSKLHVRETQCPYCSVQCKMTVEEVAGPIAGERRATYTVEGVPNEASQGRLCVKGMNAHQHALSGQRLLQPLIRRDGELIPSSWPEVTEYIAGRFTSLQNQYGADVIGVYGGVPLRMKQPIC